GAERARGRRYSRETPAAAASTRRDTRGPGRALPQQPRRSLLLLQDTPVHRARGIANETGARYILNGLNVDDLGDWRPGALAAAERATADVAVRSPLHEAGLGKDAIRAAARELHLPNWDKPALACLSSRIPYGDRVTQEKLERIGRAEDALRRLGFRQLRVRHFADRARVEIAPDELARVAAEGLAPRIE